MKHREMLAGQRTQSINAQREHAAEFDVIAAKHPGNMDILLSALDSIDIHLVQMNALTRQRADRNALGVWS